MTRKKAICLARVSTLQQELASQTEKIINAAKADGFADSDIILIENKESAVKKSESELLGIVEMKQYIEKDEISTVYCYEISRLSRRPKDLFSIRDYFLDHGVQLVVLTPYFRLLNAEGGMDATANVTFALYGVFSENEGFLRAERCKRGKQKKKEKGLFIGGKCLFGYDRDKDDRFIVKPNEAEVVRRIFNMFVEGSNRLEIARTLTGEGYFKNFISPTAAHSHISDILKNTDYVGLNGKPAIISKDLFERAGEILAGKPVVKRRKTIRTALCRGLMTNPNTKSHRKKFYVDTCAGTYYCLLDHTEEKKKFIAIHKMDQLLWGVVKRIYKERQEGKDKDDEVKVIKQKMACITRRISHLMDEIRDNAAKIEKVEERLIMRKISDAKAHELEVKIEEMTRKAEKEIEDLRAEYDELALNDFKIPDIDALDGDAREELVARLVHHIDLVPVDERRCQLVWRCSVYFKRGDVYMGYINSGKRWGWIE